MKAFLFYSFYFVFRIWARILTVTPVDLKNRSFRQILVFSTAGIGDTLTDSVAIRALKETFPQARLTVVTHRRRSAIARHNPFADEVILYHKSFIRFVTLTLELRKLKPDAVVMLRGNDPDLWPMAYLVNRHAVVSCPVMTKFGFLISHPVILPKWSETHGVEQTLDIVRTLGVDAKNKGLVYQVADTERSQFREKHGDFGGKPVVVFQLGGGRRSVWRDWPADHYVHLAQLLLKGYQVQLILLGGKDLLEKESEVLPKLPSEVKSFVGKLSLEESAALLSLSKILVSTDTGIMHLGFAAGVDTLALIHCNNPASRVGPHEYGEKHRVVQLEPPPGVPASKDIQMSSITPEQVWKELKFLCERHGISKR